MSVVKCHLCRRPAPSGWCQGRAVPFCNYHARLRLGMSKWHALRLLEQDKATTVAAMRKAA